jgi:hypothetical protein
MLAGYRLLYKMRLIWVLSPRSLNTFTAVKK